MALVYSRNLAVSSNDEKCDFTSQLLYIIYHNFATTVTWVVGKLSVIKVVAGASMCLWFRGKLGIFEVDHNGRNIVQGEGKQNSGTVDIIKRLGSSSLF